MDLRPGGLTRFGDTHMPQDHALNFCFAPEIKFTKSWIIPATMWFDISRNLKYAPTYGDHFELTILKNFTGIRPADIRPLYRLSRISLLGNTFFVPSRAILFQRI
jgi:hypothetical protein